MGGLAYLSFPAIPGSVGADVRHVSQKCLPIIPLGFYGEVDSVFLYNLHSEENSRCARRNAGTLLLTGLLHGEVQPTPPQSDTPTPVGSTSGGQVFPPEKHRPERHSVVVFPGGGDGVSGQTSVYSR